MRKISKFITATMAAATLAGGLATATEASAQSRHYGGGRSYGGGGYGYRGHDRTGAAVAAGIAGLAVGAALAGSNRGGGYYSRGPSYSYGYGYGYDRPYYGGGYGYYGGPGYYGRLYADTCVYWRHDRYGRPYQIRTYC